MGARTLLTVDQFAALPDDGMCHELDEGELITVPPPKSLHTKIAHRVYNALYASLPGKLGSVYFEAGYRIAADTVRQPDVSFCRVERQDESGWFGGAPDLAVGVVSPSDTARQINRKVRQYLEHGSEEVWVIFPEDREAHVHRKSGITVVRDTLRTELLPGFQLPLADLFAGV